MKISVDVHNFLEDRAVKHEICLVNEQTKTAKRAAALLGLNLHEIAKSIIVKIDEKPVNTIIPGDKKVCFKKLKALYGNETKIKLADSQETVDLTGYLIGTTPPVAHRKIHETLIDFSLIENDVIYTGGGEFNAMLKIRPADLQKATEALVCDICE